MVPEGLSHWIEVDLDKLAANFSAVQDLVQTPVIAVVKNDAYGFGAVECAKTFVAAGAAMLAVTTLSEALELREAGITAPVLVFLPPQADDAAYFAEYGLTATLDGIDTLQRLAATPGLACHLKLNTGMNRFGANMSELPELLRALADCSNVRLTGVYSHLATALEHDEAFARQQLAEFSRQRELIMQAGFKGVCFHLANSAGALKFPAARFDAVRLGSVLYAQLNLARQFGVTLAEPFCAKAKVAAVRELAPGDTVGYGREFAAKRSMQVAVVPFGYGVGFGVQAGARPITVKDRVQTLSRNLGKLALGRYHRFVYYQDKTLEVLGRVAMQTLLCDCTGLDIKVGDVVKVPLRRTAASARIPRVYLRSGAVCAVRSPLAAVFRRG